MTTSSARTFSLNKITGTFSTYLKRAKQLLKIKLRSSKPEIWTIRPKSMHLRPNSCQQAYRRHSMVVSNTIQSIKTWKWSRKSLNQRRIGRLRSSKPPRSKEGWKLLWNNTNTNSKFVLKPPRSNKMHHQVFKCLRLCPKRNRVKYFQWSIKRWPLRRQ